MSICYVRSAALVRVRSSNAPGESSVNILSTAIPCSLYGYAVPVSGKRSKICTCRNEESTRPPRCVCVVAAPAERRKARRATQTGSGDVRCSTSHLEGSASPGRIPRLQASGPTVLGFFLAEAFRFLAPRSSPLSLLTKHHLPIKPKPTTAASAAAALHWMEAEPADEKGKKGAVGGDGLEWGLERQFAFEREMLLMADGPGAEPQKLRGWRQRPFAADLLQNCDLPPPAKLFGPVPTLQRLESAAGTDQKSNVGNIGGGAGGNNDSLLRALRLSQSRAREAEEKLAAAGASNGDLAALLVRDSVALSAHRRWVMMLEAENSLLKGAAARVLEPAPDDVDEEEEAARRGGVAAWWVALAVCVGIAGVGLALGRFLC